MKTRLVPLSVLSLFIFFFLPFFARAQPQTPNLQGIKPPQLLSPENGSAVKGNPEFFWTSAVLPRGFRGSYKLTVVPMLPDQSAAVAVSGNSPVHQSTMKRTGEAYNGPAMKSGQSYAWCVQVVDANGSPVGENQGMSEVYVFTFEEIATPSSAEGLTITTQPLIMTGMRVGSLTVNTDPLVMTGMRAESITINTQPLIMTGMKTESLTINTQPLVMTGIRPESITMTTQPLVMTGMRVGSITVSTDALEITGMRGADQPPPPVGGDKTPVIPATTKEAKLKLDLPFKKPETVDGTEPTPDQTGGAQLKTRKTDQTPSDGGDIPTGQPQEVKEAKQKLDLPFKKPETIDSANPPAGQSDASQLKQKGTGKTVGDTTRNKILGNTPSLKIPAEPENPIVKIQKPPSIEKKGVEKTPETGSK